MYRLATLKSSSGEIFGDLNLPGASEFFRDHNAMFTPLLAREGTRLARRPLRNRRVVDRRTCPRGVRLITCPRAAPPFRRRSRSCVEPNRDRLYDALPPPWSHPQGDHVLQAAPDRLPDAHLDHDRYQTEGVGSGTPTSPRLYRCRRRSSLTAPAQPLARRADECLSLPSYGPRRRHGRAVREGSPARQARQVHLRP